MDRLTVARPSERHSPGIRHAHDGDSANSGSPMTRHFTAQSWTSKSRTFATDFNPAPQIRNPRSMNSDSTRHQLQNHPHAVQIAAFVACSACDMQRMLHSCTAVRCCLHAGAVFPACRLAGALLRRRRSLDIAAPDRSADRSFQHSPSDVSCSMPKATYRSERLSSDQLSGAP